MNQFTFVHTDMHHTYIHTYLLIRIHAFVKMLAHPCGAGRRRSDHQKTETGMYDMLCAQPNLGNPFTLSQAYKIAKVNAAKRKEARER